MFVNKMKTTGTAFLGMYSDPDSGTVTFVVCLNQMTCDGRLFYAPVCVQSARRSLSFHRGDVQVSHRV